MPRKFRRIRAAGRPLGVPLGDGRAISSRSAKAKYLSDSGFAADLNIDGGIPPASRNHLVPTGSDTPDLRAAASLLMPVAINVQNSCRLRRPATDGRPGDRNGGRPHRSGSPFLNTHRNLLCRGVATIG
jgi:hypothetical protein